MDRDASLKTQVKALMKEQGVTQEELAKRLGIKQSSVAAALGKTRALTGSFERVLAELNLELVVKPRGDANP